MAHVYATITLHGAFGTTAGPAGQLRVESCHQFGLFDAGVQAAGRNSEVGVGAAGGVRAEGWENGGLHNCQ